MADRHSKSCFWRFKIGWIQVKPERWPVRMHVSTHSQHGWNTAVGVEPFFLDRTSEKSEPTRIPTIYLLGTQPSQGTRINGQDQYTWDNFYDTNTGVCSNPILSPTRCPLMKETSAVGPRIYDSTCWKWNVTTLLIYSLLSFTLSTTFAT